MRGGFGLHRLVKGALCLAPYGPRPPGHRPGIDTPLFGLRDLCIRFRRFLSPPGRPSPQAADHPLHLPLSVKHIQADLDRRDRVLPRLKGGGRSRLVQ